MSRPWQPTRSELLRITWKEIYHRLFYDPLTYRLGRIPLRVRDLRGFSHLVASRQGLYAINSERSVLVLEGQFFGVSLRQGAFVCFQAHGQLTSTAAHGRLIELRLEDGRITHTAVRRQGLPNGCHQVDFIDRYLYVMDTYSNRVLRFDQDFAPSGEFLPVGAAGFNRWDEGYAHLNSIIRRGDEVFLLKHNGTAKTGKKSEVLRCGLDLEVRETIALDGGACHNIVFLEDGRFLVCDSVGGNLIDSRGEIYPVDDMWTRGLSVSRDQIVVGSSFYGPERRRRRYLPGKIYFLDHDFRRLSTLELPAAPTEIRRLDGLDRSLSNYSDTERNA